MLDIPKDIKETLANIGLDRAEQQVYILLLKRGVLSIAEITKELALPRSSVQLACETMLERGVVKVVATGKRRSFYVEHPNDVESFITYEENELKARKLALHTILPRLTALHAIAQDAEPIDIEELSGEDGFVEIFYRSLNQKKSGEVLRLGGDPALFTVGRDRLKKYREERMKKKIFSRLLLPYFDGADEEIKDARFKMREMRFLDTSLYDPHVHASIWGDCFAITVWDKGLHSTIIRNKAIAAFMRQLFEIAWATAKSK